MVDELSAILTISQALTGKLDLDHVLGVAVNTASDIVRAEGSSILLIDPETKERSVHRSPLHWRTRTAPLGLHYHQWDTAEIRG